MKTPRSLSVKILFLAFLNVFLLVSAFAVFARIQYRVDLSSLLLSRGRDRILAAAGQMALQLPNTDRANWDRLLVSYAATTHASAYLFDREGKQEAGPLVNLPQSVLEAVRVRPGRHEGGMVIRSEGGVLMTQPRPGEPPEAHVWQQGRVGTAGDAEGPVTVSVFNGRDASGPKPAPLPHFEMFFLRTTSPLGYWAGVHIPIFDRAGMPPDDATLVWMFPSLWTSRYLFDYTPWLLAALTVILISTACWLPLIRGLTQSISRLTAATGAIAEGKLDTRLSLKRRDELGQLSEAINRMAERLSGFVHGQRRFMSDVAHELCTPIARIQVSLGILEQRAQENQKKYVAGVQEEVEHMSGLVNELLLFSRAQINTAATPLTRVSLEEIVKRVLEREVFDRAAIETKVDAGIAVMAHPDYLFRSLANVVRNAIRYAGDCGPIQISAGEKEGLVIVTVADNGPGIPEAEVEEVFKPFYRPELARQRETGGVGLGLAIVRTCIAACGGIVTCHNRNPKGLEVEIRLLPAKP
jgi:signal transduction histidine kinase